MDNCDQCYKYNHIYIIYIIMITCRDVAHSHCLDAHHMYAVSCFRIDALSIGSMFFALLDLKLRTKTIHLPLKPPFPLG